jgi:Ser/Thr protein kinase RdoA (MazF antagonist)
MYPLEQLQQSPEVPVAVLDCFDIVPERIRSLGGGLVNVTYLVETQNRKMVIQKLGDAIQPELIQDAEIYATHLADAGWESPVPMPTNNGEDFIKDEQGNSWRGLHYIESDTDSPTELNHAILEKMGTLLARWHSTMAWLDYTPKYTMPNFHDIEFYAQKLSQNRLQLPSKPANILAGEILDAYKSLEPLPKSPFQLIHGDPKLANVLFREGKPITLIDFDTVMLGSVWLDIGDMLRSSLSIDAVNGQTPDPTKIEILCTGYYDAARPGIRLADFIDKSVLGAKQISLELAIRYLNDIVDEYYFNWDANRFNSRHDSHLARAMTYHNLAINLN